VALVDDEAVPRHLLQHLLVQARDLERGDKYGARRPCGRRGGPVVRLGITSSTGSRGGGGCGCGSCLCSCPGGAPAGLLRLLAARRRRCTRGGAAAAAATPVDGSRDAGTEERPPLVLGPAVHDDGDGRREARELGRPVAHCGRAGVVLVGMGRRASTLFCGTTMWGSDLYLAPPCTVPHLWTAARRSGWASGRCSSSARSQRR
jgi:hypothetical protein